MITSQTVKIRDSFIRPLILHFVIVAIGGVRLSKIHR